MHSDTCKLLVRCLLSYWCEIIVISSKIKNSLKRMSNWLLKLKQGHVELQNFMRLNGSKVILYQLRLFVFMIIWLTYLFFDKMINILHCAHLISFLVPLMWGSCACQFYSIWWYSEVSAVKALHTQINWIIT